MASINFGPSGFEAVRAYDPTRQYYSGLNGVLALLGHTILEITYRRVFEPRLVADTRRRTARARGERGRFLSNSSGKYAYRYQYRDTRQRSRVPVSPNWLGAPIRRMLVTRDFWMLNDWGGPLFGFVPPTGGIPTGSSDIIVVWDCLWHDWRRIDLKQPITVTSVLPTSMYPGCFAGKPKTEEDIRMLEAERDVVNRIYEANFHGKGAALFRYMDNGYNVGLQQQEASARKVWFDRWDKEKAEAERREERNRKRREERLRKKQEEEARKKAESDRIERERMEREAAEAERREKERMEREERTAREAEERIARDEERKARQAAEREEREVREAERRAMEQERLNAKKEEEAMKRQKAEAAAKERKEAEAERKRAEAEERKRKADEDKARREEERLAKEEEKRRKAEEKLQADAERALARGTAYGGRIGPGAGRRFRG